MAIVVVALPYNLVNGNNADATQVDADFSAITNYLNGASGVSDFASPGYLVLPGGLILQWGTQAAAGDGSAAASITFPIAFTTSALFFAAFNAFEDSGGTSQLCNGYEVSASRTLSGTQIYAIGGTSANVTIPWLALGV